MFHFLACSGAFEHITHSLHEQRDLSHIILQNIIVLHSLTTEQTPPADEAHVMWLKQNTQLLSGKKLEIH